MMQPSNLRQALTAGARIGVTPEFVDDPLAQIVTALVLQDAAKPLQFVGVASSDGGFNVRLGDRAFDLEGVFFFVHSGLLPRSTTLSRQVANDGIASLVRYSVRRAA